jgi:uncharacterized protein involved in exopolysaccharide biosynthesis
MTLPPPTPSDGLYDTSPRGIVRVVVVGLERRRTILAAAVVGMLAFAVLTLAKDRRYSSTVAFIPSSRPAMGGISAFAAQLGLAGGSAAPGTPDYYSELATSSLVLRRLATDTVPTRDGPISVADLLRVDEDDQAKRTESTMQELDRAVSTRVAPSSGIVPVGVVTRDPLASKALADRLMAELTTLDRGVRNAQAGAEHEFTVARRAESYQRLREAESRLQQFLNQNRNYAGSPQLQFERERLQRAVDMEQQLYVSLATAEQTAALDEARDTPTLSILAPAEVPARPLRRGLALRGIAGMLLGGFAALAFALLREEIVPTSGPDLATRLAAAWSATRAELARLRRRGQA